ncbi:acetyl-CoA carboxylase, biotin carboxylase, partial [Pseudomonas syringae pv. actinidiae ICMP 19079]
EFFFMEMNTRLQVEHPVTEYITGLDLVEWQIRVARGESLPITQVQVPLIGHAMEVRLYAEDPANDFLPATGTLRLYREPASGLGRRVDSGVAEGDSISPFYDPMLGKLIAWGENREEA